MKKSVLTILTFLILISCVSVSLANEQIPDNKYKKGVLAYENGEYEVSITTLDKLLNELKLTSIEKIIKAHSILGACYLFNGKDSKSKKHFETVLNFDINHELDATYYPPRVVARFEEIKKMRILKARVDHIDDKSVKKSAKILNDINSQQIPKDIQKDVISVNTVFKDEKKLPDENTRNPFGNCFIPFGVGQFKNNQPTRGYIFMSSQIITLASTLATISAYYGLRHSDGTFDNPGLASRLKAGFYTSLTFYILSTALGMADAATQYREFPYAENEAKKLSLSISPNREGFIINGMILF